jgi:hypothetical protein
MGRRVIQAAGAGRRAQPIRPGGGPYPCRDAWRPGSGLLAADAQFSHPEAASTGPWLARDKPGSRGYLAGTTKGS